MIAEYSARLRRLIEEQGTSIRAIAARAGVDDELLWDVLQGRKLPSAAMAKKIAVSLRLPPDSLAPPKMGMAEEDPDTRSVPKKDRLGFPVLHGNVLRELAMTKPEWRRWEIARIARRQNAIINIMIRQGTFTREEWEEKLSAVVTKRTGQRF